MNLTDYLAQSDLIQPGAVKLQPGEYQDLGGGFYIIPALVKWGVYEGYLRKDFPDGSNVLLTKNQFELGLGASVFSIA